MGSLVAAGMWPELGIFCHSIEYTAVGGGHGSVRGYESSKCSSWWKPRGEGVVILTAETVEIEDQRATVPSRPRGNIKQGGTHRGSRGPCDSLVAWIMEKSDSTEDQRYDMYSARSQEADGGGWMRSMKLRSGRS